MPSPEGSYAPPGAENFHPSKVYVGTNTTSPEGWRMVVSKPEAKKPLLRPVGHTSKAEAAHAFLALELGTGVKEISVVADPHNHSNGHTIMDHYNGIAAAAHIDEGGGSWDAFIIESMGDSVSAMKSIANGMKARGKEQIHAIADHLEHEKPVITGSEAITIMETYNHKKKKFEEAKNKASVFIISPDGHTQEIKAKVDNGYVEIPRHATVFSRESHTAQKEKALA